MKRIYRYILEKRFKKKFAKFMDKHSIKDKNKNSVLVWELGGFARILAKNSILAKALELRGYHPKLIVCDGTPEACMQRGLEINEPLENWSLHCKNCKKKNQQEAEKYSMDYSFVGDYISKEKIDELRSLANNIPIHETRDYRYFGIRVGELAWASTVRYMKGYLTHFHQMKIADEIIFRKYLFASLINTYVANECVKKFKPISILTSHGVYVDYAPPLLVGVSNKIPCISWSSGFADFIHYFTVPRNIDNLSARGISKKEWEKRLKQDLTEPQIKKLEEYLHNRYFKSMGRDIPDFSNSNDGEALKKQLGILDNKKIVCLFTHVNWDAGMDLSPMLFETANQWVLESIKKMSEVKNVNWLIKLHPGELIDGSLYSTQDLLHEFFKEFELPSHVKIIPMESKINPYTLYSIIDAGITIYGTVGAEITLMGKQIITAGESHFSGKGFSMDPKTQEEYFKILESAHEIAPLSVKQVEIAKKYAYSYFIQRQIPMHILNKKQGHWGDLDLERMDELLPQKDPVMDKICEGILSGKDVILD